MNILMISPRFPPEGGGLEIYAKNICHGLLKKGHRITVVCSTYKNKNSIEKTNNLKIIRQKYNFLISNTPIRIYLFRDLKNFIKKERFDVINAHMPVVYYADVAALAASIFKIPMVITYHASSLLKGKTLIDSIAFIYKNTFQNFTLNAADKIIAVSHYAKNYTIKKYRDKTVVIHPSLLFDNQKVKKEKVFSDVLFLGQLRKGHEWKGLSYLLKAIFLLKDEFANILLEVVGGGNMLDYYKKLAVMYKVKDNVIFKGNVASNKIYEFYNHTKIVAVPSYSAESFPAVCAEAGFFKKPVVASNIGGIPEIIQDGINGYLIDSKDVSGLTKAIKRLLISQEKRESMGESGHKIVQERFGYENFIKKTEEVFLNAIKNQKNFYEINKIKK